VITRLAASLFLGANANHPATLAARTLLAALLACYLPARRAAEWILLKRLELNKKCIWVLGRTRDSRQ
jgi:hypothetical protein